MIFEAFKRMREEFPGSPAFLVTAGDRSIPINWRQFTDDIDLVVRLVREYAPGEKVMLLGENSYEWMVAHAAIVFGGATVLPTDVNLTAEEIAARVRFTGATVLVYSALYSEKAHAVRLLCPGLKTGGFGSIKTERFLDRVRSLFKPHESVWSNPSADVKRVSMIVFTSGTTSEPRGAELTLEGLETFISSYSAALEIRENARSLMLLPLHHIFGLCSAYFMLVKGVAMGVCPDFRRIYDAVERFRANFIFLVPALADILAAKIEQHGKSVEAALGEPLDWVVTGGADLPRRVYERLTALGVKAITAYGLTETTAFYSISPSAGAPCVGSAGKVAADSRIEARVSETGELLLRGPSVMKGYFRDAEKTAEIIDGEGWFHTGDLGRIDDSGYVWVDGRISRTIILDSGKKIAPEELESRIMAIPGILECVVHGEKDTRDVVAEIYAEIPDDSVRRVIGEMNLAMPVYKRVKHIITRHEPFPRTSSGKIMV